MPLLRHFISRCIPPQPHCPIDGKSTLHRRKIHAPSTENPRSIDGKSTLHRRRLSYTGSTPLLYPPKRLASPTPHSHHRHRLPNFLFAPRHQQPYPTAILPHSPSRSIALYLYTSPSSSIYTVRASDSRFTSISPSLSLSLSQRTQTRSHTHLTLGKNEKEFLFFFLLFFTFPIFFFFFFFFPIFFFFFFFFFFFK